MNSAKVLNASPWSMSSPASRVGLKPRSSLLSLSISRIPGVET
jgi:hypothetical protein